MKTVLRLVWLEGLATLLALAILSIPAARRAAGPFLPAYPIVVVLAGIVMGFRFSRFRLLAGLLTLLIADRALAAIGAPAISRSAPAELIALLLPVNLALLGLFRDGPVLRAGRTWLAVIAIQALVIGLAYRFHSVALVRGLALPLFPIRALDRLPVPQIPLIAFVAAIGFLGWRARGRDSSARGLLWATVASAVAVTAPAAGRTLFFATAGLALVVAMVEASYALAFQDDLTGLPGRRAFNQALAELEGSYVVAMVDVDHFKQFNDRHGHDVGDQVLKLVANRLSAIDGGGRAYRYGGEEFAVVFPEGSIEHATAHLEALRENIEATTFTLRAKDRPKKPDPARRSRTPRRRDISVTVSIGAAQAGARTRHPSAVVKSADRALYRAKETGRNRVVVDE